MAGGPSRRSPECGQTCDVPPLLSGTNMSSRLLAAFVVVTSCVMPCPAVAQNEALITAGTKSLPLPGESFRLNGQDAFVIAAKEPAVGSPWVFYAPTLKNLPGKEEAWMLERFLKAGIGIAGIDVGESYGSPKGRAGYDACLLYTSDAADE